MKNAIIIHGRPSKDEYYGPEFSSASNSHWIPWLQKQFQIKNIFTQTPEMPLAFDPKYDVWKKEFERFEIGPETILVGHSCGAGFMVRWLSENKDQKVGKVVFVAPWLGYDYGDPPTDFFDGYEIDPKIANRTKGLTVFHSNNDFEAIQKSVEHLRSLLEGAKFTEFHGYGHFCYEDMKTVEFPKLLEECLTP